MISEAIQQIEDLAKRAQKMQTYEWKGNEYYIKNDTPHLMCDPSPDTIKVCSLTGFITLVESFDFENPKHCFINISTPTNIGLFGPMNVITNKRPFLIDATADLPTFNFGHDYYLPEFIVGLTTMFVPNASRDSLVQFVSKISDEQSEQFSDDGVTQTVIVKKSLTQSESASAPNPVVLAPFRTFLEIDQPMSPFVFRIKGSKPPTCKLHNADGGAWRNEARLKIADYLPKDWEIPIIA